MSLQNKNFINPCFVIIFTLVFSSGLQLVAQSKSEMLLFHGDERFTIEMIPYSKPPSVHLGDVLTALNIPFKDLNAPLIELSVNRRKLVLDRAAGVARYKRKSSPFPLRSKGDKLFVNVDYLTPVFNELLGRNMIYEKTSKSLHLPKNRDVHVGLKMRKVKDGYHVVLTYSHPIAAPRTEKAGRNLIVKIKASPIIWEQSGFETNDAVTAMELYENLPDGSTEILFRIGPNAKKYNVDPYTPENPRTVIKISGRFDEEEAVADTEAAAKVGVKRIMIDPGHGGKDQGAKGPTGLLEKDVTLELSKSLQKKLTAAGYDVRLTRKDDTLLSLKARTGLANEFKSDLFISIHVNAIRSQNATGSETYYLSLDASENYHNPHYEEFGEEEAGPMADLDDDLSLILWDMAQTKHIEDSFRVSRYIQQELNSLARIRNRGVKQAPLKVLKGAVMPAVLIETAFISNKNEEQRLRSSEFKGQIVEAIFTAINLYSEDVVRRSNGRELGGEDPRQ